MAEEMEGGACPVATRDITINLQNRGKAIDKANYGPMNPRSPDDEYWQQMAAKWDVPVEEAMSMRCGNCAAFNQTEKMMACIAQGLGGEGQADDPMDTIEAGDLGFCEIFDFKCAAERTCDAWIVGGPIKDEDGEDDDEAEEYDESDEGEYEGEEYEEG
jgi:hypothetical protein